MLYLVISRTRPDLTDAELVQLAERAKHFYGNVPQDLMLHGNWAEEEGGRTFALLETDSPRLLERVQAPFRAFVDIEVIPLIPISGWEDGRTPDAEAD